MSRFRTSRLLLVVVLAAATGLAGLAAAAGAAAATTTYTITDLGSLGAGVTHGLAINASGQVTGDSVLSKQVQVPCPPQKYGGPQKCFANPDHAFLWSSGTMTDLGTVGNGLDSQGVAINDSGQVVGWSSGSFPGNPFMSNGHGKGLVALRGTTMSQARGINDSGQIAGQCGYVVAPEFNPCVVSNGTATDLPDCANGTAVAINNNGQVVGNCGDNNGLAVVWTNDTPTVLGTLGGGAATPTAINNLGQVVGTSQTATGAFDGALWSNGTVTDLGSNFSPAAINDSGVIVGGQFVYSDGTLQNLNTLIPAGSPYQIDSATGINDKGQIVANALDTATNQEHALLLTPS
jgi:probable HAF family extracellular repeat protein